MLIHQKGCIYLGLLNDYTGPYGAAGPALEKLVKEHFGFGQIQSGGIGDYSVAIVEGYDTQYNPQKHLEGYNAQRDECCCISNVIGNTSNFIYFR